MAKHKYTYKGTTEVHLPEHGILAKAHDHTTVYETDKAIHNPDFEVVKEEEPKRKEQAKGK